MNKHLTKDTAFKPARSRAETKTETTDRTARDIIDAEAAKHRAKTAKLRVTRLAAIELEE